MDRTVLPDLQPTHPLTGLEGWPRTGPVYGLADDRTEPRAVSFWEKIAERFWTAPQGEDRAMGQARVWY